MRKARLWRAREVPVGATRLVTAQQKWKPWFMRLWSSGPCHSVSSLPSSLASCLLVRCSLSSVASCLCFSPSVLLWHGLARWVSLPALCSHAGRVGSSTWGFLMSLWSAINPRSPFHWGISVLWCMDQSKRFWSLKSLVQWQPWESGSLGYPFANL